MLKNKIVVTFLGFLISAVCNLIFLFILTQNFEAEKLGEFFWALAVIGLTSISTGIDTTHVKKYSDDFDSQKLATFFYSKVLLSLVPLVVSVLIFKGFILGLESSQLSYIILILGLMNFSKRFYTFFSATYTALGKVAIREAMHMSQSFSKLLGVLVLFFIGFDLISLSYVYFFSSLIPLFFGFYFFKNVSIGSFSLISFKDYLYFTFPLFLSEGLLSLFQKLDKIIIVFFLSYSILSVYVLYLSLINLLKFLNKSLGLTIFPKANNVINTGNLLAAQELFRKTNSFLVFMLNTLFFGVLLFSNDLLYKI